MFKTTTKIPHSPEEKIHVGNEAVSVILSVKMWWWEILSRPHKEKGLDFDPVPSDRHTVG